MDERERVGRGVVCDEACATALEESATVDLSVGTAPFALGSSRAVETTTATPEVSPMAVIVRAVTVVDVKIGIETAARVTEATAELAAPLFWYTLSELIDQYASANAAGLF